MKNVFYTPCKIGNVEIKNRLVMGPAGFGFCDETKGMVNDRMVEFFRQRARGGVGLIDVGAVQIDPDFYTEYDMIKLNSDECIPGFRKLTDAIHAEGGKVMAQLLHQGRYGLSKVYGGKQAPAPSAVYTTYTKETPYEMTTEQCEALIEEYGKAAARAVKAGFDIVELGTNSGYLIGQFLSAVSNLRTDRFGGATIDERATFLLEAVAKVRQAVGPDVPISVRIGGNDFIKGGTTNQEACRVAELLEQAGVDCINVTGGWHECPVPQTTMETPYGLFAYLGKQIKEHVNIPVIQSNHMCVEEAEKLLYEGVVDFISMCRPLVADPYLMNKASEGRYSEIRPCVSCNQGCLDNILRHHPITCLANAEVGREHEVMVDGKLPTEVLSEKPEKILVVGAGPAGMEFARVAKSRGHNVTIWEKREQLGGQFEVNSAPPGRHAFARLWAYLAAEMKRLEVEVVLNKEASTEEIEALVADGTFDRVVIATGALPITPRIPTEEGANVVQAWDVLRKRVNVGKNIVVVGGGAVGVETAEYLAEMGTISAEQLKFMLLNRVESMESIQKALTCGTKKVTLVEMQPKIGRDIGITHRWGMISHAKALGVTMIASTKVIEILKGGVKVQQEDGTETVIPADTVVLAIGSRSVNALYEQLQGKVENLMLVGDAGKPAFILDAIRTAYDAAYKI